jgi:phospholipase D1/2
MKNKEYDKFKQLLEECIYIPFKNLNKIEFTLLPTMISIEIPEDECKISSFTAYLKYGKSEWKITKYKYKLFHLCSLLEKDGVLIKSFKDINVFTASKDIIVNITNEIFEKSRFIKMPDAYLFFRISQYSFFGEKRYEEKFILSISNMESPSACCACILTDKKLLKSYYLICKGTHILFYDYKHSKKIEKVIFFKKDLNYRIIRGSLHTSVVIIEDGYKYSITSLFKDRLEDLYEQINISLQTYKKGLSSYATLRSNNIVNFFVDGKDYFDDLYYVLKKAKKEIYIAGWWIFPKLYLERTKVTPRTKKTHRLDFVLRNTAKRGVKIYILIYQEIQYAVSINSGYTYDVFTRLHSNISVIRHPYSTPNSFIYWSHHEKIVIVDQRIAYIGGIDLCLGRYDTDEHLLFEKNDIKSKYLPHTRNSIHTFSINNEKISNTYEGYTWPGMDFSNPLKQDFKEIEEAEKSLIDRSKIPRMPWHDIQCKVVGGSAFDISLHFIERWNYLTTSDLIIPNETYFSDIICDTYPYVLSQALRSIGKWSLNKSTENSIYLGYLTLIRNARDYIYIENQFFITSSVEDATSNPKNLIGLEIVNRIIRAHKEMKPFKVYIIIPLLPAFELDISLESNSVLMHLLKIQSECIKKHENSFINVLEKEGIDYKDYVLFLSLQKYQEQYGKVHCEQIYVHSKLIVADGKRMIIGSANINDRSMLGDRDSEACLYIEDLKYNQIDDLIKKLFKEHIGYKQIKRNKTKYKNISDELSLPVLRLSDDTFFKEVCKIATNNTNLYHALFNSFLSNQIRTFRSYYEIIKKPKPNLGNKLKAIIGNFVLFPFEFLIDEDLSSGFLSLDSIIPEIIYY